MVQPFCVNPCPIGALFPAARKLPMVISLWMRILMGGWVANQLVSQSSFRSEAVGEAMQRWALPALTRAVGAEAAAIFSRAWARA